MSVSQWSTTPSANATADIGINLREGQSPGTLNDSVRALMAEIAKWRNDLSGNLVTAGSGTAYTLATNQVLLSLTDGLSVAARIHVTNGAAPTLNVDSLGARAIATVYGTAVGAGKLRDGAVYVFVYDSTDTKWIVHGNPNEGFESGTKMLFRQTAAPVGWTKDTTYTDAALRLTSGTISQQDTAGKKFSDIFASRTITTAMLPSHTHTFSATSGGAGGHSHTVLIYTGGDSLSHGDNGRAAGAGVGGSASITTSSVGNHTHSVSGTTAAAGSGSAFPFDVNFVDIILATRN